ncbi:hypothetical protein [Amycolatopsis taiwanensis]|uniref:Uncharacterized protein n=1 Tax=Amycolatopsis taiwanensis TaxID=342230 RepID=A0A9W6VGR1_9PSEU|nr:hypothetical protein [Amycolatopsis taiwanensis]GLY68015.1 hypothetical protein Atai01_46340 [Amycolatopsis taiwanensis]
MSNDSVISRRAPVWGGLLAGAIGIYLQKAGGVNYDAVPPGAIIFVVGALLVLALPWAWVPLLGVLVSVFMIIGFVSRSESLARLGHPGDFLAFLGTWIQVIGVVATLIFGITLTISGMRTAKAGTQS